MISIEKGKANLVLGIVISLLFLSLFSSVNFGVVKADEYIGTYSGVTDATDDHWAYGFNSTTATAWGNAGTEATNASYATIITDDDTNKWTTGVTSGSQYVFQRYHYDVDSLVSIGDITQIDIKCNTYGYVVGTNGIYGALYNDDTGVWLTSDTGGITGTWTHTSASDSNILFTIPEANVSSFLNTDGIIKFALRSPSDGTANTRAVVTDYVEVKITYNGLSTPSLVSPTASEADVSITPDFDWNVSTGGTSPYTYELMVDTDIAFGSPDVNVTGISDSNYSYTTGLTPNTTYYWKVRTRDKGSAYSSWATTQSFTTASFTAPTISSPTNGIEVADTTPTITWSASTGGSGTYTYEVMIDTDSGFATPDVNVTAISGTSYTPTTELELVRYYTKVRAKDSLDNYSAWSSTISFTVIASSSGGGPAGSDRIYDSDQSTINQSTIVEDTTVTSSTSSTNIFTRYIINPLKTNIIDPVNDFVDWASGKQITINLPIVGTINLNWFVIMVCLGAFGALWLFGSPVKKKDVKRINKGVNKEIRRIKRMM